MSDFLTCLIKFAALDVTYKVLDKNSENEDDELISIMRDSVVNPLNDLLGLAKEISTSSLNQLKDIAKFKPGDLLAKMFLQPFQGVQSIFNNAFISKSTREKIKNFIQQEGIAISLLDPKCFSALIFSSAIKGVTTIGHNRRILKGLDNFIKHVLDEIEDIPTIDPPISPFLPVFDHLESAKSNYSSVRSALLISGRINIEAFDRGNKELKLAQKSLYDGHIGELSAKNLIQATGTGGFLKVRKDGHIEYMNEKKLGITSFLPPVHITRWIKLIKLSRTQLALYNANIENIDALLKYVAENLYIILNLGRLFAALIQFLNIGITDVQERLQSGINKSFIDPGMVESQTEAYGKLEVLILLANYFKKRLEVYNRNDINDIPLLKTFRKKLLKLNPSKCSNNYKALDQSLTNFISAYNRRIQHKLTKASLISVGENARSAIKQQLVYLDCFEDCLNVLGLDKIPADVLKAIAWLGSAYAMMGEIFSTVGKIKDFVNTFDLKAIIISEMKEALICMQNACSNPIVKDLTGKLVIEFDRQDKLFKTGSHLNADFAKQTQFHLDLRNKKFAKLIQQFISTVSSLAC